MRATCVQDEGEVRLSRRVVGRDAMVLGPAPSSQRRFENPGADGGSRFKAKPSIEMASSGRLAWERRIAHALGPYASAPRDRLAARRPDPDRPELSGLARSPRLGSSSEGAMRLAYGKEASGFSRL